MHFLPEPGLKFTKLCTVQTMICSHMGCGSQVDSHILLKYLVRCTWAKFYDLLQQLVSVQLN